MIDEGYLDSHEGYWVEDEEDGAEGFLEADEDAFWVYDEENYTWFQRRFQGRKMKRGFKGRRKGKGKGGKGSGGKRFFKRKKGRSNLADDQTDAWQAEGQWQDGQWNDQQWDDWSWYESEEAWAAKGKGKKGKKGKGKGKYGKDSGKDGKSGSKDGSAQLADSAHRGTTTATTFFVDHIGPLNFSFMATEEEKASFIAQPLTPTSMVLDLGCTRAMASRVAAQDLMKFCDHNPDCGIWYHIAETTSQFTFANSESTKCNQKLVVCMYDKEYVVQSTEVDIVKQGHVPILMSLPQMRNLRFQFELHPDKALLSSPVLGIWDVKLNVAPSSHLVLDLLDLSRFLWNVRFDKHKKSSFLTYFTHYEYGFHQKTQGSSSQEEVPEEFALATDDEWVIEEATMELIRVHKQMRKALYQPKDGLTPIPLEFLNTKRKTIMEFHKGKSVVKEDDWSSGELPTAKATESWKGRTIFRILAGGIESRTSVPAKSSDPARGKKGSPNDIISKGKPEDSSKGTAPPGNAVLRVNQSKVRRDGDPWHDVAIPLRSDDSRSSEPSEVRDDAPRGSSQDEALDRIGQKILDRASAKYCYEHEICFHSLASGKSDFVEITPHLTGLTACTVHSGLAASVPVEFGEWDAKDIQSSIESTWQVILAAEPDHIIIHPVIPSQWPRKTQRAFCTFVLKCVGGRMIEDILSQSFIRHILDFGCLSVAALCSGGIV